VQNRRDFLGFILLTNGIIDILCAAVLLILPQLKVPLLGYEIFDLQGAFMAGGWGIATLALGVTRTYTSGRPEYHGAMLLLGVVEGICLAIFSIACFLFTRITITQVLLSLMVGCIFGVSYLICVIRWKKKQQQI
jgi:hypothetical protein